MMPLSDYELATLATENLDAAIRHQSEAKQHYLLSMAILSAADQRVAKAKRFYVATGVFAAVAVWTLLIAIWMAS